jgi:uncharacterized cupredoxin-like copper-binding protein/lysophospholipase L1-like esterase
MIRIYLLLAAVAVLTFVQPSTFAADQPHIVIVAGTTHYSPQLTMPPFAKELERFGFKTTVVLPKGNPERDMKNGLPGIEALEKADLAIFFMRFLTLPEDQFAYVENYLKSGKPVVGFRTSSHAFMYPKTHKLAEWNDGFGRRALGSKYFIHGGGNTTVKFIDGFKSDLLTGLDPSKPLTAAGTLYLAAPPKDATVLLRGTGQFKRTGKVTNGFGTHDIQKEMTQDLAWTWTNEWGGRVFSTTLGHTGTFAQADFVRLFINGIHWAASKPVPGADKSVNPILAAAAKGKDRGKRAPKKSDDKKVDAKNKKAPPEDPEYAKYAIYGKTETRPNLVEASGTKLPLQLKQGDSIAFIGNTLLDRAQDFGWFEAMLQKAHGEHNLVVRNLSWSADTIDLQPRPSNFADTEQHLTRVEADVIFAAFGFNESFAGEAGLAEFKTKLNSYVAGLKSKAFNKKTPARIVLVSPIANENVKGVPAADLNNANIKLYADVMKQVAAEQQIGYIDVYTATLNAMKPAGSDMTFNGVHMLSDGYRVFGEALFEGAFGKAAPTVSEDLRQAVVEKNKQYFRRFRPINTFYYTGGRNKSYGYLDFLPAMKNFEIMTANRDKRVWDLAQGKSVKGRIDDSNVPPLPEAKASRGANKWMTAADELKAFKIDPRFEVNLFAGEEDFPDIACPIQIRWDERGRLWVACSTTYPHVYPGNEPNDKLVILEDTDGDGRADKSSVFADDLHIPLSFEFGDGGVYVSEEPHMTFIKDTDGDGKADFREKVLTGFGCEDSHHALHDFSWTPDGELVFRESVFHHSQVETPYGPVRQYNSGWFRYRPDNHRLTSFGTYRSTNPWGVTYDDWGQHVASHPNFASAFHALDPVYPKQHVAPKGLKAYSGTAGQEFVDFGFWPEEMQGGFIKVRYKPTNRVEIHKWKETPFGFEEEYVSDLIFSSNLSFIPVDCRYGPRGAFYICDWYNPIKGHAQYSLRDERRDRKAGRIWRVVPKDAQLQTPPKIAGAATSELLDILKRPEYRYRYWAKRVLREQNPDQLKGALDTWVAGLDKADPRYRHHQIEAIWLYRGIDRVNAPLLVELLNCDNHNARAAATRQLRYWHGELKDAVKQLQARANDDSGLVRLEAAIAATYIGGQGAFEALVATTQHPAGTHLEYAIRTSLDSKTMKPFWAEPGKNPQVETFVKNFGKKQNLTPVSARSATDAAFDTLPGLKKVRIECLKERMLFSLKAFAVKPGQPVRLELINPDATAHNLVMVQPGAAEEVGTAANEMAKNPNGPKLHFIPKSDKILRDGRNPIATKLLAPGTSEVLRFKAPTRKGVYPYLCTFPGHWVIMRGEMTVK